MLFNTVGYKVIFVFPSFFIVKLNFFLAAISLYTVYIFKSSCNSLQEVEFPANFKNKPNN